MKESPKVDFDAYAKDYNQLLNQQLAFFDDNHDYFAEYKIKRVRQIVAKEPQKILDFGCGTGRSSQFLQAYFPDAAIYGTDPSTASLAEAKKKLASAIFLSHEEFKQSTHQFDLIFIAGVFHHIAPDERASVMSSLFTRCQRDALVVVFEHNPWNPLTRYLVNTCPFDEDAVLLRPKELKKLFSVAGLTHISMEYTLFFPAKLKFLRSLERYLKYIPLGGQYMVQGRVR